MAIRRKASLLKFTFLIDSFLNVYFNKTIYTMELTFFSLTFLIQFISFKDTKNQKAYLIFWRYKFRLTKHDFFSHLS